MGILELGPLYDVAAAGKYTYVTGGSLTVLDVSDPRTPIVVGAGQAAGAGGVAVEGRYAYVTGPAGLTVFDISEASAPRQAGAFATGPQAVDISVAGDYVSLAAARGGLYVLHSREEFPPYRTWLPLLRLE